MKILHLLFYALIFTRQIVNSRSLDNEVTSMSSRVLDSRIVGGYVADPEKYPFFCWLFILRSDFYGLDTTFCGGSLIAPDVVMTAAHCISASTEIDVWVNSTTRQFSDYEYRRKSIRKVIHPNYKYGKLGYDIALIFLDSPVKEVPFITRNTNTSFPGNIRSLATTIGFGQSNLTWYDENSSPYPEYLMEVQVYSIPRSICVKTVGTWAVLESEICAGDGKKGACYGDSGGPLFLLHGSKYIQIGIVARSSSYNSCLQSKMPQIYTSTAYFATWIDENICKYSKHKPKTCSTSKPSPSKPSLKPTSKIP
jgi:secreted trypsin-like serine protease